MTLVANKGFSSCVGMTTTSLTHISIPYAKTCVQGRKNRSNKICQQTCKKFNLRNLSKRQLCVSVVHNSSECSISYFCYCRSIEYENDPGNFWLCRYGLYQLFVLSLTSTRLNVNRGFNPSSYQIQCFILHLFIPDSMVEPPLASICSEELSPRFFICVVIIVRLRTLRV